MILPGTEGLTGYDDYGFHFRGFLIGIVISLLVSLLLAAVVAALF
jgi:tetrahydromethanopterin S-methyltransferase subunit B